MYQIDVLYLITVSMLCDAQFYNSRTLTPSISPVVVVQ